MPRAVKRHEHVGQDQDDENDHNDRTNEPPHAANESVQASGHTFRRIGMVNIVTGGTARLNQRKRLA
jgi:hypothetical protein